MRPIKLYNRQSGLALFLSLVLLFILTLVAVASFSSTNVQERAAGNIRLQTMAFEAAAAGANNAIDFFLTQAATLPENDPDPNVLDQQCGASNDTGWYDDDDNPVLSDWIPVTYDVDGVNLYQRMYCLVDTYPCTVGEPGCDTGVVRAPRSQLFVLSRGEVVNNGTVVAFREVEVRIDRRNDTWTAEGCGAVCFPACDYLLDDKGDPRIDFPSSNVFQVDGGGGSAVTTGDCDDSDLLDTILGDIKDSRLGNYDGGLHQQDPGSPWNDPTETDIFRDAIRDVAENTADIGLLINAENPNPPGAGEYFADPGLDSGGVYEDNGNTDYRTSTGGPMVVYVEGDLEFGGNVSGAGIIMVEGDIFWNGTPNWEGLIVTLGGSYTIDGGGTGGDHAGSVVVLNNNGQTGCSAGGGSCDPFGGISWENTGGGTAEYNWNCDALLMAFNLVDDGVSGNPETPWGFDCDRSPPTLFESPGDLIIASWRENLGWRTDEFSAP
ncbi:MAG: hypothetical protein V2I48_13675 [Xanthomonadales bacterium]|jgi:hypothetical protein|nr:hypothetical protein [Xanthomonadales bacterium]